MLSNSTSTATITATTVGTCLIQASKAADSTYSATTSPTATFTFTTATQTITFDTPSAMTLGGSTQTVAPTTTSSLTVTLTSTTTGICTVASFVITAVASGTCSITASQAGNSNYETATDVIRTFAVTAAATAAAITTQPAGAGSGSVLGTQPVIRIVDSGGNTVTTSTVNVVASIASGTGTLSGTTTIAASSGIATFTDLVVTGTAGTFTLTFTPTSLTSTTSNSLTITAGPASKVAITRASVGTQRRIAFTTQPQITIRDASNNTVTSSTAVVTATITSGAGGSFVGTTTATASSGLATFTGLGVDGTIGTAYTITYTVSGLTVATATINLIGTTCDGTFTCQVGDTGPGGGKIFYVATGFFTQVGATGSMCTTGCNYLEAAPSTGVNAWTDAAYVWSGNTNTLIGASAQGTAIGTGFANTLAIVGQSSGGETTNRAGTTSRAYRGPNNLSDWYLPSKDELNQLNLENTTVGGFVSGIYWSSSERTSDSTWAHGGGPFTPLKNNSNYVRPIRAFGPPPTTISVTAIAGVAAPVTGATPATTITSTAQFTGSVYWEPSASNFLAANIYTATITLTPTPGYTFTGISANFFTVVGATSVSNSANSGVITAEFPATVAAPAFTLSSSSEIATVNTVSTGFTVNSTGGSISTFAISPTAPAGMSFNTSTGAFSGTPSTVAGAITYTITATNATGSASRTFSFTIGKATPTLSNFNNTFKTKDVPTFTLTAPTVANSLSGTFIYTSATTATATISGATVTLGNTGTTVITATFTPSDTTNYNNATISMTLTVALAFQLSLSITSLTTNTKTYSYLGNSQALSITTSGGSGTGATTFAIQGGGTAGNCQLNNSTATATISAVSAGTCLIRASKAADSIYSATTSATATFTFSKATPILSNFSNVSKNRGDGPFNLAAPTVTPGINGSFTFSSATSAIAAITSQGRVTVGFAGNTVVTATFTPTDTTNYNSATITMTLEVFRLTQAALSISSLTTNTKAYPYSQALSMTTSGGSGTGGITFAIASGGTAQGCTLSDSTATATITATTVGTCLIQATKNLDSDYYLATSASASFTFTTASQTITFDTPSAMSVGGSTQTVTPTASSSLEVTLTSTTTGICLIGSINNIAGFYIEAVASGTCSITASQAGNANFAAAVSVIQTFAIKVTPSLSNFADLSKIVGDASFTLTTPTVANSLPGSFTYTSATTATATISGATVTLGSAGTTVITATFTPTDSANYNNAIITMTLTVITRTCATGGTCSVGDRGPGGGYVFYVSASYFTSAGSTCNTSCKYLEVAPSTWYNGNVADDGSYAWGNWVPPSQNFDASTEGFNSSERINWKIGQGFYNTSRMPSAYTQKVLAYAGNSIAGQWFIPSMNELNELCKYAWGQATGDLKVACASGNSANFKSTSNAGLDRGGFVTAAYWSSSENNVLFGNNQDALYAWYQSFTGFSTGYQSFNSKGDAFRFRPIRAFGP
jgi:hypothetical protein